MARRQMPDAPTAAARPFWTPRRQTIGLIAGNGQFPLLFAEAAKKQGIAVVAVGMLGETQPDLVNQVDALTWVRVGQLGRIIRTFQRAKVTEAAMAGGVRKTRLFGGARPDWQGIRLLARCALRPDDGLLRAVAKLFEDAGIIIVDSTRYMPEALAPAGVLTQTEPTAQQWRDLHYGYEVAQEIGRLDIGQTVIVKSGAVVALEAIEGTDACIQRAGTLTGGKGAVMVKIAKPSQDMRFDVPAIGVETIRRLALAGIGVVGIEAHRTLMLQPEHVMQAAHAHGVVLVGLTPMDDAPSVQCVGTAGGGLN